MTGMDYKNIYFIGIGGIGMSALARYFKFKGYSVSGYDRTASTLTRQPESEGIEVHYEDNTDYIPKDKEATLVVYTPAVPAELAEEMTAAARTLFRALGCRDLARVDFRMDGEGRPCFLEINPLPGLAPGYSDFPMAAETVGYGYNELICAVAETAARRIDEGRWGL